MIEDLYLNPFYWVAVGGLVALAAIATRSAFLGFRFIVFVFLSQYFVHAFFAFGVTSDVTWFTAASWVLFFVISLPALASVIARPVDRLRAVVLPSSDDRRTADSVWFWIARVFLLLFFAVHLVVFPFSLGSLDLGSRLAAQQDNKFFFLVGQLTLPAIAACMAMWLRRGYRFTWIDVLVVVLTAAGLLGGGSKATLLPLALAFFGAAEMAGRRLREFKRLLVAAIIVGGLAAARLLLYFPDQSPLQTASFMLYRIAANTDSLEYLQVIAAAPSAYPAAGPLALIPYISKRFGYAYPYPPGVWLFGQRYGDYGGQGPNSGFVMDFFGDLGWGGLALVVLLAVALVAFRTSRSTLAIAAASVVYLAFVDITLFDVPLLVWTPVAIVAVLLVRFAGGSAALRSVSKLCSLLDRPLPRIRRRASTTSDPALSGDPAPVGARKPPVRMSEERRETTDGVTVVSAAPAVS